MKFIAIVTALTDAFSIMEQSLCDATKAVAEFGKALSHAMAVSVKALSRERRREYWALRKSGMYPMDALAQMKSRHR